MGAVSGMSERVWGECERGVREVAEVNGRGGEWKGVPASVQCVSRLPGGSP